MLTFAMLISIFFAMNIGASGTAAAMGSAYGGGAIKNRNLAVVLVGICALLGACLGGGEVVKTISKGIVSEHIMSLEIALIILISASMTLFIANLLEIPLSTSEVTVGSLVGVGIAFHSLYITKLLFIVSSWIIGPFIAYCICYFIGKKMNRWKFRKKPKLLILLLILTGCYEAFSAGMNNVANAVGPLVGAGIIAAHEGVLIGGIFLALGALFLGGPVLETNGKKITKLSLGHGSLVSFTGGTLVIGASLLGLPIPLTQLTTMGIMGIGAAKEGNMVWKRDIVRKIVTVWVVSPVASLIASFFLVESIIFNDIAVYNTILATCSFFLFYYGRKMWKADGSDDWKWER